MWRAGGAKSKFFLPAEGCSEIDGGGRQTGMNWASCISPTFLLLHVR